MATEYDVEVVVPGREATEAEVGKMPARTRKQLDENGWEYKYGYSRYHVPPQVYKGGAKAGEEHGEEWVDNVWVDAIHRERKIKITAVWHNGSFDHAQLWTGRSLPELVNSVRLAKLIRNEEE